MFQLYLRILKLSTFLLSTDTRYFDRLLVFNMIQGLVVVGDAGLVVLCNVLHVTWTTVIVNQIEQIHYFFNEHCFVGCILFLTCFYIPGYVIIPVSMINRTNYLRIWSTFYFEV